MVVFVLTPSRGQLRQKDGNETATRRQKKQSKNEVAQPKHQQPQNVPIIVQTANRSQHIRNALLILN